MKKFTWTYWKQHLKILFFIIFGAFAVGLGIFFVWLGTTPIPDFNSFDDRKVLTSTKIYDRTGEHLLYDLHEDIKRTIIPPDSMGANIKNATVAIEDSEFYQHQGIRLKSIARAFYVDVFKGKSQGGSTITQQVVKNSLLTGEKTLSRKLKEWILSIKIDNKFSKDEILGIYLNESPYGGTIYGVAEASQTYFKKNPEDLTIAEAAYLAAIPQAPTFYSPYGKNRARLDDRKNTVLKRMHDLAFITTEQYEAAKAEVITFNPQVVGGISAPHFVFYVRDYLLQQYGEQMVYENGLKVITTLDWDLQQKAEKIVKEYALKNEKSFKASNAGLVAVDPKTGQILTMVGSRDYFDKAIDGEYNIATAKRQPGSSFKPFAYATAFKKGFLPETVVFDVPTEFSNTCATKKSTCYNPDNYDNLFKGPISLRAALAESRNVPSVKTLYLAGISDTIKTAREMGIRSLTDANQYGLTLVLGGGEVGLLDMTSAYGVFANKGVREAPTPVLAVTNQDGTIIEEFTKNGTEVLPKNVALQIADVLSDNKARTPTFGATSPLYFGGRAVAAKTGTTNDNRDAWLVGFTPSIAVGVWSGNNDNSPMSKSSSTISGPLWHAFMVEALKTVPVEDFDEWEKPANYTSLAPVLRGNWQGGESYFIDTVSGGLATVNTPEETKKEIVITNVHSILYWVNKNDPTGTSPTNPSSDSQFHLWEPGVLSWWRTHSGSYQIVNGGQKPAYEDTIHTPEHAPQISITSPMTGTSVLKANPLSITVSVSGQNPIQKVDFLVNGDYVGTATTYPFSFSFIPGEIPNISGTNTFTAIAADSVYNKKETSIEFSLVDE